LEKIDRMVIHISEEQTITELSTVIHQYDAEIYIEKLVNGSFVEVNLKSFLGLIVLKLQNGDEIQIRACGPESVEAVQKIKHFFGSGTQ
jgi:phosphocarrier protein HPr